MLLVNFIIFPVSGVISEIESILRGKKKRMKLTVDKKNARKNIRNDKEKDN